MEDEAIEQSHRRLKLEDEDCICSRHILNSMLDALFDIYKNVSLAKEFWKASDNKYM